jgi:hypothetical protein
MNVCMYEKPCLLVEGECDISLNFNLEVQGFTRTNMRHSQGICHIGYVDMSVKREMFLWEHTGKVLEPTLISIMDLLERVQEATVAEVAPEAVNTSAAEEDTPAELVPPPSHPRSSANSHGGGPPGGGGGGSGPGPNLTPQERKM